MLHRFRSTGPALVAVALLFGAITAPGCSSKAVNPQTAEVVPDPAVRPAPAPTTAPTPTPPAEPKP